LADHGSATPDRVDNGMWNVGNAGTGMTWPPTLPFGLALERARALDRSALGMLYRRFLPVVYRYVLARVGTVHAAEDVASETFFAAIEDIGAMRAHDELTFAAWVLGIARNKVAMHFRRLRTHPEAPQALPEDEQPLAVAAEGDPLAIITARESWSEVVAGLNRLTEEQRAVVLYRCVLGYSTEDVARLLEKQPNAVRALQFRALASLARHLGAAEDAQERGHASSRERGEGNATRR
jgi:RNA polymerase sigma-70 factor (ECF subfamily)